MAIEAGDVIFSSARPCLKNIAVVPRELDGQVASTAYCVLRPETAMSIVEDLQAALEQFAARGAGGRVDGGYGWERMMAAASPCAGYCRA